MGFIPPIAKLDSGVVKEGVAEPPIFLSIGFCVKMHTEFLITAYEFRDALDAWEIQDISTAYHFFFV